MVFYLLDSSQKEQKWRSKVKHINEVHLRPPTHHPPLTVPRKSGNDTTFFYYHYY